MYVDAADLVGERTAQDAAVFSVPVNVSDEKQGVPLTCMLPLTLVPCSVSISASEVT